MLRHESAVTRLSEQVKAIAAALRTKAAIPMVAAQMPPILDLQTDPCWTNITAPPLEIARRRIRGLVAFIDRAQLHVVHTHFTDQPGAETPLLLPGLGSRAGEDLDKFRAKTSAYPREHFNFDAVHMLHTNQPIIADHESTLERVLVAEGLGNTDEDAREAMVDLGWMHNLNATQVRFTTLVVDYVSRHGVMNPRGPLRGPVHRHRRTGAPDELFTSGEVDTLIDRLDRVRRTAEAA